MKIESERAALQDRLGRLQGRLAQLQGMIFTGAAPARAVAKAPAVKRRKPGRPKGSAVKPKASKQKVGPAKKRGQLTQEIVGALKAAKGKGVSVSDLSSRFRIAPRNVFVWFSTTAKTIKGIKKVKPGVYAMKA